MKREVFDAIVSPYLHSSFVRKVSSPITEAFFGFFHDSSTETFLARVFEFV